eukprot:TRINITY_DN8113_c0_g1_i2.p2 TRINITY_DN8113_c0_g1~~TRINITY_DN8113_c0_g1_i2.p2  ORF type:complete len:130 (-),score=34.15 TRINITY_DN8113_c0_g1_i2:52-441(-)
MKQGMCLKEVYEASDMAKVLCKGYGFEAKLGGEDELVIHRVDNFGKRVLYPSKEFTREFNRLKREFLLMDFKMTRNTSASSIPSIKLPALTMQARERRRNRIAAVTNATKAKVQQLEYYISELGKKGVN